MIEPGAILGIFVAAGLFLFGLGVTRLRKRRPVAAARSGLGGCLFLAIAALLVAVGLNLYTYQRLTHEQPVATLSFRKLGPQRFLAHLDPASGPASQYILSGDQWRLEARVLKWTGVATLLGFDTRFRLERLSGRYADPESARRRPHTAYALASDPGINIWQVAARYPDWLPLVDAGYGSGAYLPMADGARYIVTISQTGLLARPANAAAESAIREW